MSARIPHLLTRLLSSSELDALRTEMLERAARTTGPACAAWLDAVTLLGRHRSDSFERRSGQTPSARRKSLSAPPAKVQAYADNNGLPPGAAPSLGLRYTR